MVQNIMAKDCVILTRDRHGDKLWEVVGKMLDILTHEGYTCIVEDEEPAFGIVTIRICRLHGELSEGELQLDDCM